jgi:hypothetical protein
MFIKGPIHRDTGGKPIWQRREILASGLAGRQARRYCQLFWGAVVLATGSTAAGSRQTVPQNR